MELITIQIADNCDIFLHGDTQIGNALVHEEGIQEMISKIASNPDNHAVHTGDCIDGIMMDDKRFFPEEVDPRTKASPLLEAKHFIKLMQPIAAQLDCILWGNHDYKLWRFGNIVRDEICQSLNVRYGGYKSKISYVGKDGKKIFKLFVTHGRKGIFSTADDPQRKIDNMKLILKRHLYPQAGDCEIMAKGHNHQLLVLQPTENLYLYDDGKKIKQGYTKAGHYAGNYISPELRWYVCTGSFLRTQGIGIQSYTELLELPPVELGYVVIEVRDRQIMNIRRETL